METDLYDQFRNLANSKRFVILADKMWVMNNGTIGAYDGTGDASQNIHRNWLYKISKKVFIPIEYDNTTGALSGIRANNIGILVGTASGARIMLDGSKCRIRFIDR